MEDLVFQLKSISNKKLTGLFIALVIVLIVLLIPALPSWLVFLAAYPLITSLIDIVLYFRS